MGQKPTREEAIDFTLRAVFNFSAEFIATAAMIFVGNLSCVLHPMEENIQETAAAFGFGIIFGIEMAINTSGGHLNPMSTIACTICGYVGIPMAVIYILGQMSGGLVGFGLAMALYPKKYQSEKKRGPCVMYPHFGMHPSQAFFLEFACSSIFVLVLCSLADYRRRGVRETFSLKLGLTVYTLTIVLAPNTGASLNPVKAFAPALWNNSWEHIWIYWGSSLLAAIIWSLVYSKIIVKYSYFKKDLSDGYKLYEFERERRRIEREREKEKQKEKKEYMDNEKGDKGKEIDRIRRERMEKEKQREEERELDRSQRDSSI